MDTRMSYKNERGFSLIELLVALAILAIVITGIYSVYNSMHKTWLAEDTKAEMQQYARVAMDNMVRDMMMAGYGAADTENKITIAAQNVLEFKEYYDGYDGLALYFVKYSVTGGNLYKDVYKYDNLNPTTTVYTDAQILASNVQSLAYSYYYKDNATVPFTDLDAPYVDASDKGDQPNRDLIRRITVSLKVKSAKPLPGTDNYPEITLTADLSPRNLWEGEMTLDTTKPAIVGGLEVIDARNCGQLIAKWPKSPEGDVVGYLLQYGQAAGAYTGTTDVTVDMLTAAGKADAPEYPITVDTSPYDIADVTNSVVTYYVNIMAYDRSHNYSELMATDVSGNPPTDTESFADVASNGNDTTCNLRKPDAPGSFSATSQEAKVELTWQAPAFDGLDGYRVYRKSTPFVPGDFPLGAQTFDLNSGATILQLANEDGAGSYPAARQLGAGAVTFTDDDAHLVGCTDYYYAICAVGCDRTLIWASGNDTDQGHGGRYTNSQYATTTGEPGDDTPPAAPNINAGTQPGWRRVFLQHTIPASPDYAYTKLYYEYTSGSALPNADPPPDPPLPTMGVPPDPDTGYAGIPSSPVVPVADVDLNKDGVIDTVPPSEDMGSLKTTKTIVFNHLTNIEGVDAEPALPVNSKFKILAVAFDKCDNPSDVSEAQGVTLATLCDDEPPGAPAWPICDNAPDNVWSVATTDALNASTWTTYPANTTLSVKWEDINKGPANMDTSTGHQFACPSDPGGMVDFQGFAVRKGISTSFTPVSDYANFASVPDADKRLAIWSPTATFNDLREGSLYYFCIQAADCYFWSRTGGAIEHINISPENALPAGGIMPGKLDKFRRPSANGDSPEFYFATSAGVDHDLSPISTHQYHNNVTFYLQNTSLSELMMENMIFTWDDPAVALTKVTIGPLHDNSVIVRSVGTAPTVSPDSTFASVDVSSLDFTIGADAQDRASSSLAPSGAIPVTLEFKTAGGVVNEVADMRLKNIVVECQFTNSTIKDIGGNPLLFTTGEDAGTYPPLVQFTVSEGAKYYSVKQSTPKAGTVAFMVDTAATGYSGPTGYSEVNGATATTVTANVTRPSDETIRDVTVHYVQTDTATIDPAGLTFTSLPTTRLGNEFSATIPGQVDVGVWYYLEARTNQGNLTRSPKLDGSYYYYRHLSFDPCLETPMAPTSLTGAPSLLKWAGPTLYVSGGDINEAVDNIKYNLYRRVGLDPGNPEVLLASDIDALEYPDTTYLLVSSNPVIYYVVATNSCTDSLVLNDSAPSNELTVCPTGGGGCAITPTPADIYAGSSITLRSAVCSAANNGLPNQTGDFTVTGSVQTGVYAVTEIADTGTVSKTITTSQATGADLRVVPAGSNSDTLAVTLSSVSCDGESGTVHVYMDPNANTPKAPATVSGSLTGSNAVLTWSAVTQNTDNSPVTYTAGSLAGDSIAQYEVWSYFSATSITPPDPNTNQTGWNPAATLPNTATTSGNISVAKGYTYFVVRALDTVGGGTFSQPAVAIQRN